MRTRLFITTAAGLAALFVLAGAIWVYDSGRDDRVANGITAGGVDIGGLSRSAAEARLRGALLAPLQEPIAVHHGKRTWKLGPREARIAADVNGMVDEAIRRSRRGNIISRALRDLTGGTVEAGVKPRVKYSRAAVVRLLDRVRRAVDRPARDATIAFTSSTISKVPSRDGLAVDARALHRKLDAAIVTPGAVRGLVATTHHTKPKVTTDELAQRNATVIIVNRSAFQLRLFKHLRLVKTYPIAVGQQGLETPSGTYTINDRQINPSWHVPNSKWAGKLAGKVIPPGPQDPIKARWLGFYNGAGIHGTDADSSIGTAASHGCIRMHIPDVIDLFPRVPYGTPIHVA